MNQPNPKPKTSQPKAHGNTAYQIQMFIQEFKNPHNAKTFNIIEENFIKKFRYRNSLSETQSKLQSLTEFINGYKETLKYYEAYHEHLENTLGKYDFSKGLQKFFRDLRRSQQKSREFFMNQIEFHKGFVQQNEAKYEQRLQNMNEMCISCKQNYNKKTFQTVKENVVYPFSDPFNIYNKEKASFIDQKNQNIALKVLDLGVDKYRNEFQKGLEAAELAQTKMRKLIKESKQISGNGLDDIFDMFENKKENEVESINKERINEMFYDLQNDLNNRANQIEEYIDQLMTFNDRLINYNSGLTKEIHEQNQSDNVENELKSNFQKMVKKIYKKVTELIQKRKDESISVDCQANFSQDTAIRELEKQKKKLTLELRQCQEEKRYLTNSIKAQNQKLSKQLAQANDEKIKVNIAKQQAQTFRNSAQSQEEKLIKVISQMRKENQRLIYLLDKEKRGSRFAKSTSKDVDKRSSSRFKNEQILQPQEQKNAPSPTSTFKQANVQNIQNIQSEPEEKLSKSSDQQFRQQLEQQEIEFIKNIASKKIQHRKKFMVPRRSKLSEIVTVEETSLQKELKRISNFASEHNQQIDKKSEHSQENSSLQKSSVDSFKDLSDIDGEQHEQNESQKEPTQTVKETENSNKSLENKSENRKQAPLKNHKSKTCNQLYKSNEDKTKQNRKTCKQLSLTSEDVQKQLQQLQKINKMKQIEKKLDSITKQTKTNLTKKSALGFNIEKQVEQSVINPKYRVNTSKSNLPSRPSLQKDDLIKRFGKPSIMNNSTSSHQLLSVKHSNTSKTKQYIESAISISSKYHLNNGDEISKDFDDSRCHVEIQTAWSDEDVMRMMFDVEVQKRKWSENMISFKIYKVEYEQFINQLTVMILNGEFNPSSKPHPQKSTSSTLKRSTTSKLMKNTLLNRAWKQNLHEKDCSNITNKTSSKTIDQRHYLMPKMLSQQKKSSILNHTSSYFYNRNATNDNEKLLNCVAMGDYYRNFSKYNQLSDLQKEGGLGSQGFAKKGYFTLHHMKTDAGDKASHHEVYIYSRGEGDQRLPMITENLPEVNVINLPSFSKEDAENLFLSVESAKVFQQKVLSPASSSTQPTLMTLQPHQIKFSTQILATLAHIHLTQPAIYDQIKTLLLYPVRTMSLKRTSSKDNDQRESRESVKVSQKWAELSLKKGLGFIIHLHRKCITGNDGAKDKAKMNSFKGMNNHKAKSRCICTHLVNFRSKIGQVIRAQQASR